MPNFKSATKRKRELAKLDKRQAKDQKRALRKAERSGAAGATSVGTAFTAQPAAQPIAAGAAAAGRPTTVSEAMERWKKTKVAKPQRR
jgi:hypothetical protein